ADFEATFAMAILLPPMYGQCPAISRAEAPHDSFRERFRRSCLSRKIRSEQAKIYPFQYSIKNLSARKRPSALSALSDGLLISAGVPSQKRPSEGPSTYPAFRNSRILRP